MTHRIKASLILAILACLLPIGGVSSAPQKPVQAPGQEKKNAKSILHDAMRKLWEDHITWTRLFLVSAAADLPDKQATTNRLLQNQVDIGNAIKPYYGRIPRPGPAPRCSR